MFIAAYMIHLIYLIFASVVFGLLIDCSISAKPNMEMQEILVIYSKTFAEVGHILLILFLTA